MVQRTMVVLEDDIDGAAADETVLFGLDGVNYEIDLSADNARKLRESLDLWAANARRVGGRKARGRAAARPARSSGGGTDIRTWARENGYEVSDRGRVPADIRAAYEDAH